MLFCVASFTDFLDGYVARKYNQVTDFGKFVDPLADKLLVASALILFVEQKAMAGWMVCVILARELIITSLRVVAANKGRVLAATWTGKVKTCVQIGGIIIIYLYYIILGGRCSAALLDCLLRRETVSLYSVYLQHRQCTAVADHCRLGGNAGYHLLRL